MKQFITLSFFALISITAACQENLSGIGIFKVGEFTVDQLMRYAKEFKFKFTTIDNRSDEAMLRIKDKKYFAEVIPNIENYQRSPHNAILCEGVRVFMLSDVKVSGINVKKLTLSFKDKILYDLNCDFSTDLSDAIEVKYGKGKTELKEEETTCLYNLTGNQVKLKERTIYTSWSNEKIHATAIQRNYYNSKCEEIFRSFITINDISISGEVLKKHIENEKDLEKAKKAEKAKSLSDF